MFSAAKRHLGVGGGPARVLTSPACHGHMPHCRSHLLRSCWVVRSAGGGEGEHARQRLAVRIYRALPFWRLLQKTRVSTTEETTAQTASAREASFPPKPRKRPPPASATESSLALGVHTPSREDVGGEPARLSDQTTPLHALVPRLPPFLSRLS